MYEDIIQQAMAEMVAGYEQVLCYGAAFFQKQAEV